MPNSQEDGTEELGLFGGQTRVVVSRALSAKPPEWHSNKGQPDTSTLFAMGLPSFDDSSTHGTGIQEVHPPLGQHMSPPAPIPPSTSDFLVPTFESQPLDENPFVPHDWNPMPDLSQAVPLNGSLVDPYLFDLFHSLYEGEPSTGMAPLNTWASSDHTDLGVMMNMDSDIDEQWVSFMRENGMGDPTVHNL